MLPSKPKSVRFRFILRFLLFFSVGIAVWYWLTPLEASFTAWVAEPLVRLIDSYNLTQDLASSGASILHYYSPSPTGLPFEISYRFVNYNDFLLFALIMAVPGVRPRLRLKILLLGFVILFPTHVAMVLMAIAKNLSLLDINKQPFYSVFVRNALFYIDRVMTRINGELFPVLIWAGLYYFYEWHKYLSLRTKLSSKKKGGS